MTDDVLYDRDELLRRYALVGGPAAMIPLLERVSEACTANSAVADLAKRQSAEIFEGLTVPTTDDLKRWTLPERELGEAIGAYCMMLALSGVPKIAATHRKFGFDEEQLAKTYSWFRAMIWVYARRHDGVPGIEHTRLFWFRNHADGVLFRFGSMEFLRGPVPDYVPAALKSSLGPDDEIPTFHFPGGEDGLDTCDPRDWPAENSLERAFCEVYRRGAKLIEGCAIVRCSDDGRVLFPPMGQETR